MTVKMLRVPWEGFSEDELLVILEMFFSAQGYEVYNWHESDRRAEEGVDLELRKALGKQPIFLAAKKQPKKSDLYQLEELSRKPGRQNKIYVMIRNPTGEFRRAQEGYREAVEFWDASRLDSLLLDGDQTFQPNRSLMTWLMLDNLPFVSLLSDVQRVLMEYFGRAKEMKKSPPRVPKTEEYVSLLWELKDRSVTLCRVFLVLRDQLHELAEDQDEIEAKADKTILRACIAAIRESLTDTATQLKVALYRLKVQHEQNLLRLCHQTLGRTCWKELVALNRFWAPGTIVKTYKEKRDRLEVDNATALDALEFFSGMIMTFGNGLESLVDWAFTRM